MPSLVASLEGTIARAGSQLGQWWPNPWWPGGNPKFNDCAAFVSWCLWGLNGNQPFQTIVSGIIERSGLEFHAGAAGIRRGDIAGFRWTLADNYDHTEIVLGPPNAQGFIQTIGANGGGSDRVAIHTRSTGYVHNYARPAYPGTSTAGNGSSKLSNGETIMAVPFKSTTGATNGWPFLLQYQVIQNLPVGVDFVGHYAATYGVPVQSWDDAAIWIELVNHGFGAQVPGQDHVQGFLAALAGAKTLDIRPAAKGGTAVDLAPVLAAITALDKQADDYEAKLEGILNKGLTISGTAKP